MSAQIPEGLHYTESHEWIAVVDDIATIGITDFAQNNLTDVVFVELPEKGDELESGRECAVAESTKAAADVYAPLSGTVVDANAQLANNPGLMNSDPYGDGWIFKLRMSDPAQLLSLMDSEAYQKHSASG